MSQAEPFSVSATTSRERENTVDSLDAPPMNGIRILHTADLHLGASLYDKKRYAEYAAFLNWLAHTVEENYIDVVLISGDIFDNTTPSNRAQKLYFDFLCNVKRAGCSNVVVTAGNHDSPSLVDIPADYMFGHDIFVFGEPREQISEEVVVLKSRLGSSQVIVCAVPYLPDRYVRKVSANESQSDKDAALVAGIAAHYRDVVAHAVAKRQELGGSIPIVAMGHMFLSGGYVEQADGERNLYVGSLAQVSANDLPSTIDYMALGHIHKPQRVGASFPAYYSGAPIPISFSEAAQKKSVCVVDFSEGHTLVHKLSVPRFQELRQIKGSLETVEARLRECVASNESVWCDVECQGEVTQSQVALLVDNVCHNSQVEVLRKRTVAVRSEQQSEESVVDLEALSPAEVFQRVLEDKQIAEEQRGELKELYDEVLFELANSDNRAE